MKKKFRIVICVEGGIVNEVQTSDDCEIILIDHDIEIEDVHTRAKMHDLELNDKDAEEILEIFEHRGDASVCISWDTMDYAIHEWLHIKSINPAG